VTAHLWGLGLRPTHFSQFHALPELPPVEIMADNLLHHRGGPALHHTLRITQRAPCVVLHGIGMNIGGAEPLSATYLHGIRELERLFSPQVVSDHLCFTQAAGLQSYELLPIIRNKKALDHVVNRVDQIQQTLGRQFCLENVSAYISYHDDSIPEGDFLNEIAERSGCGILLDVNNIFVSAHNFALDPFVEMSRFEAKHVKQIHVAGHSTKDDFLFDTHDTPVCETVWLMLGKFLKSSASIPVILENDKNDVELATLLAELELGKRRCNGAI